MQWARWIVVMSLAIALGCASSHTKKPTDKELATKRWSGARAAVLGQLAREQYESGNFDKSRLTLNEALRLNPDSGPLHLLSAKLAIEQGQLELADKELAAARRADNSARRMSPSLRDALARLTHASLELGESCVAFSMLVHA